ncbi:MAG TPA: hypothetical protein VD772_00365 [Anseongella sp.]|nr:hypothetical protein [Anseongella sp.]
MKLIFLSCLVLLSVLLVRCEKEPASPLAEEQLYDVHFTVKGFTVEDVEMQNAQPENTGPAGSYLTDIDFFLYDDAGDLLSLTKQDDRIPAGNPNVCCYGENHYRLAEGNYKLIVVGSFGNLRYLDSANYATARLAPVMVAPGGVVVPEIKDIFYKELDFVVDADEIVDTLEIERLVGQLEVRLQETTDDLWRDARMTYLNVVEFPFSKDRNPKTERLILPLVSGQVEPWKNIELVFRGYVLPDKSGSFVTEPYIEVFGPGLNILFDHTFEDVVVNPNRKVIVSGTLTGYSNQQNFYVLADSAFADTTYMEVNENYR